MFFKDDIFSYFHTDLCVNTTRRTFEAGFHSCCRIYCLHAVYIAIILLFLQMVGVRPTNAVLLKKAHNQSAVNNGTNIATFQDLVDNCNETNFSTDVFKEVEQSVPWVNTTIDGCDDLKWRELLSTLPPNSNPSFLGWNISCNSVKNFNEVVNEVKTQKDFFLIALESYDCKQKYSTKNSCAQCLVSSGSTALQFFNFYGRRLFNCLFCSSVYEIQSYKSQPITKMLL